ncbi:conjugal transfer protein [Streptomyces sp. 020-2-3H-GM]|uniref:conjugal transfer protein n=1 Tax=Streptomyces sp. 020-2-3H-GM TaxID=2789258 RepID=UPI00398030B3
MSTTRTKLTRGQAFILSAAAAPMVAVGAFGGAGTYSNIVTEFNRAATAIGVVAAGEGVTLVLALVMVGVTMLGQAAPAPVRLGLWVAPIGAGLTGVVVADDVTEAVVYGMTPLAMSAAAEGLGFLARRIVVYTTGVDMEAQRRNAATMQRLAYHQARAAKHPDKKVKWWSERASWRLARRVGHGDAQLGHSLVEVQREQLTRGAGAALADMYALPATVTDTATEAPVKHSATEVLRRRFAEMDPSDAIRIAHDAHPDAPPAELASMLITYGVVVDAVQVALVLYGAPQDVTVERDRDDDANDAHHDAPQVGGGVDANKTKAILEAAAALGPDVTSSDVANRVKRINGITVKPNYVRTTLSREAKKAKPARRPMEGGYA